MLEIIFTILSVLVCAFYLYVLLQFRRESMRMRGKPESITYMGSNRGPTILFPVKGEKRPDAGGNPSGQKKLAPIARQPAAKGTERELRAGKEPNRLPYLEVVLPVTAVVTPINRKRETPHIDISERRRA